MTEFLTRMRQRKLVQWAVAYVAGAWAVLQALGLVADSYHWTDAIMHLALGLLALGFVVMLLLAWYHGERGIQRVSSTELLIIALVLAVGGAWLWRFERAPHAAGATRARSAVAAATSVPARTAAPAAAKHVVAPAPAAMIPAKSVAVLPFENLSADQGNAYFADGMRDLILTKLADVGELKVISRTSTLQYGSHPQNLKRIGEQLGVAAILEGSVQKVGNQVLINLQLVDAKTDTHIWAESYQRTLDNIFGVEGEVATKVANALQAKLTAAESTALAKVGTHNPEALDALLKASYYLNNSNRTGSRAELARSVPLAKQAIAADPGFAAAYTLLALAYQKLGGHAREAEAAALHALKLDPDNADAHTEYAFALVDKGEFDAAIAEARKAVALPGHGASNIDGLGFTLAYAGRFEDAEQAFRQAVKAAPRVNFSRVWAANMAASLRRYAVSRDRLRYVVVRDPGYVNAVAWLAKTEWLGFGNLDAARKTLQATATPVATSATLADAWYELEYVSRDYQAALAVLAKAPSSMFETRPRALYEALTFRAQGNAAKAWSAFATARDQLETRLRKSPNDADVHAALAQALAGQGEGEAARAAAKRALALVPVGRRSWVQQGLLVNLAAVQAHTGHVDDAIRTLDKLMSMPAGLNMSIAHLRLHPAWDPIRHDARFQALLEKYRDAPPVAATSGSAP